MDVRLIHIQEAELEAMMRKVVSEELKKILPEYLSTSNNTREGSELIGTKEACEILGICPRTMQRYRDRGCFSVVMRGPHKALYYRSEILAFRDANRIEAR